MQCILAYYGLNLLGPTYFYFNESVYYRFKNKNEIYYSLQVCRCGVCISFPFLIRDAVFSPCFYKLRELSEDEQRQTYLKLTTMASSIDTVEQ